MRVILDPQAGTCGGVRRAIQLAEEELTRTAGSVFVLGDIIHNEREVERLDNAGLRTIRKEDLDDLAQLDAGIPAGKRVIVRAHGEPPETFKRLNQLGVEVVDGTCPVVTRSQDLARQYQQQGYQVAIVGKHGHPEMIGIVGHTEGEAVVVQHDEDIKALQPGVSTMVMAQTTISPAWFDEMTAKIRTHVGDVHVKDTLCRFVVRRDQKLPQFATQADVILVVGGHRSSNTKMLHATCQAINPRSFHVVTTDEIDARWFDGAETVGVTGSASTPLWLLHEFVDTLEKWIVEGWPMVRIGELAEV
ncbi:MAG: 4-hydroxy-3-methylbut-2-enyl diphosphate reductase [Calditrichaeota bacterium]|nr:4-hydroxy-3-methylbut-2-enyl diphosphate reductase [Calditrichota bacterium]